MRTEKGWRRRGDKVIYAWVNLHYFLLLPAQNRRACESVKHNNQREMGTSCEGSISSSKGRAAGVREVGEGFELNGQWEGDIVTRPRKRIDPNSEC